MKRNASLFAAIALAVLAFYSPPASADHLTWSRLVMRNTTAASAVVLPLWTSTLNDPGYADSTVFRRGATTRTLMDTTIAYHVDAWNLPPTFAYRGASYGARAAKFNGGAVTAQFGQVDSVVVDTTDNTPWILVRVRQDSSYATGHPYAFTGTTAVDSILVAAQYSYDGINWLSVSGTPTRAFIATTVATAEDGLQPPVLTALEVSPGADAAEVALQCQPELRVAGAALIINRTLCIAGAWVRFLIGVTDGSGQFCAELGEWTPDLPNTRQR
jgi:hypothetical protein